MPLSRYQHIYPACLLTGFAFRHFRFTRVQRVTCCVTFLLSWMCVDAMWFGTFQEGKVDFYLGFKGYSYEEVLVGVVSSLMVFPINMIFVLIFRKSRLPQPRVSEYLMTFYRVILNFCDLTKANTPNFYVAFTQKQNNLNIVKYLSSPPLFWAPSLHTRKTTE